MVYATTERCSLVEITYTVVGAKNPATGVIQRMGIGMQQEFLPGWYPIRITFIFPWLPVGLIGGGITTAWLMLIWQPAWMPVANRH
jgi:hypothetical protein